MKKLLVYIILINMFLLNLAFGFNEEVSANEIDTTDIVYEEENRILTEEALSETDTTYSEEDDVIFAEEELVVPIEEDNQTDASNVINNDLTDFLIDTIEEENLNFVQEEIEEELKIFDDSEIEAEIESIDETNIILSGSTDVNNTEVKLNIDLEETNIELDATYEENGELISKKYEVVITSIVGEDFTAEFIDRETGEELTYSTIDAKASIAPAIPGVIALVGGQLLHVTVTTGVKAVVKQGSKVLFSSTTKKAAQNALKSLGFNGVKLKLGNTGKYVNFSKGRFEHILTRHHPKYWTGSVGSNGKQSFFDPNLSAKTIQNYIKQTINSNSKSINSKIKKDTTINVVQKINGTRYNLGLYVDQNKQIYVRTFYPD